MCTCANSEDPDEHDAFSQGLHCLLRHNSENELKFDLQFITRDPSLFTMVHPNNLEKTNLSEIERTYNIRKQQIRFY